MILQFGQGVDGFGFDGHGNDLGDWLDAYLCFWDQQSWFDARGLDDEDRQFIRLRSIETPDKSQIWEGVQRDGRHAPGRVEQEMGGGAEHGDVDVYLAMSRLADVLDLKSGHTDEVRERLVEICLKTAKTLLKK